MKCVYSLITVDSHTEVMKAARLNRFSHLLKNASEITDMKNVHTLIIYTYIQHQTRTIKLFVFQQNHAQHSWNVYLEFIQLLMWTEIFLFVLSTKY